MPHELEADQQVCKVAKASSHGILAQSLCLAVYQCVVAKKYRCAAAVEHNILPYTYCQASGLREAE